MSTLSVVIITYNEAHHIKACLESVAFADECIVIDSGSTDDTVRLAKEMTSHVYVMDWPGDGPQRNRGIEKASAEWVLCLDADERVTPELAKIIRKTIAKTKYDGFSIPFISHYLGKPIRWGDWRGERHTRLFRRQKGSYSGSDVHGAQGAHCRPVVDGEVGRLKALIKHYPFPNLEAVLRKVNAYSTGSAALKVHAGYRCSVLKAVLRGWWTFFRGYILKMGFLDGAEGFILALSNAHGTQYRYLKVWFAQKTRYASLDPNVPSRTRAEHSQV